MRGINTFNRAEYYERVRQNIRVLLVDDEKPAILEFLKTRKYNVYYKSDMIYPLEAEPFDIIMVDIKGIGKARGSSMEGFSLATEIKREYPLKKVIVYSGSSFHKEVTNRKDEVDAIITRDEDPDIICKKLDIFLEDFTNPEKQWEIIYTYLKESNLKKHQLNRLKKQYLKSFESNDIKQMINFSNSISGRLKDASAVINIINSVISLAKVLLV